MTYSEQKPQEPDKIREGDIPVAEIKPVAQNETKTGQADQKSPPLEIRLNSYEVVGLFGISAVHNEIAFYEDGKPTLVFNGNAHDRETGLLETFTLGTNHTLRVSASNQTYEDMGMKKLGSVSLAKPNIDETVQKLAAVVEASDWINRHNFDYRAIGGVGGAQNSNSVASALVKSMGYEYPAEAEKLWAPGYQKPLLPAEWKATEDWEDTISKLNSLSHPHVVKAVRDEKEKRMLTDGGIKNAPDLHNSYTSAASGEEVVRPQKITQMSQAPREEPGLSR